MRAALAAATTVFAVGMTLAANSANAGTQSVSIPVTATIIANCTISTSALAFGNYDPVGANAAANLDSNATLTTVCTTGSSPTIALDQGANQAAGSTAAVPLRQLASGINRLSYSIYSDATRLLIWGSTGVATPTATGTAQTNTVYGRISSGQNKPAGSYTDTVVATVTF